MKLPPLCRYCGKALPKSTHTVRFGESEAAKVRDASYITHRTERPKSKAEAQRLLNTKIVACKWSRGEDYYAREAGFDFVHEVSTWDGESYRDRFFCNGDHARQFAYACACLEDRPLAMPEYWEALKRQKEAAHGS